MAIDTHLALVDILETFSISSGAGAVGGFVAGINAATNNTIRLIAIRKANDSRQPLQIDLGFLGDMLVGAAAGVAIVLFIYLAAGQTSDAPPQLMRLIPISLMAGVVSKKALAGMADAVVGKLISDTARLKEAQKGLQDRMQKLVAIKELVQEGEEYLHQGQEEKVDRTKRVGRYESARDKFVQAVSIDENNPFANLSLARSLKRLAHETSEGEGRARLLRDAIESASRAINAEPTNERAFYNRACYKAMAGAATEEVLSDLQNSIKLFGQNRLFAQTDSDFEALRSDARFRALVDGPEAVP